MPISRCRLCAISCWNQICQIEIKSHLFEIMQVCFLRAILFSSFFFLKTYQFCWDLIFSKNVRIPGFLMHYHIYKRKTWVSEIINAVSAVRLLSSVAKTLTLQFSLTLSFLYKCDKCQTVLDGSTHWALPGHTTSGDFDRISRLKVWYSFDQILYRLIRLVWTFIGLLSVQSR